MYINHAKFHFNGATCLKSLRTVTKCYNHYGTFTYMYIHVHCTWYIYICFCDQRLFCQLWLTDHCIVSFLWLQWQNEMILCTPCIMNIRWLYTHIQDMIHFINGLNQCSLCECLILTDSIMLCTAIHLHVYMYIDHSVRTHQSLVRIKSYIYMYKLLSH